MIYSIPPFISFVAFFLIFVPSIFSQGSGDILSVRGKIGNEVVYQFIGTTEDIQEQCAAGYVLMQNAISYFDANAIPSWTANGQSFNPLTPATFEQACETIVASAEANEIASQDARFHAVGKIDDEYEFEFTGNFLEIETFALDWLTANNLEFAFMISFEGWDGNTYTVETPLLWSKDSIALLIRAFSKYIEPATISTWEIH